MAQESEAKESFDQLEMLKRTHDKLRTRAEELEYVNDKLFGELEIIKKTLLVRESREEYCSGFGVQMYVPCLMHGAVEF